MKSRPYSNRSSILLLVLSLLVAAGCGSSVVAGADESGTTPDPGPAPDPGVVDTTVPAGPAIAPLTGQIVDDRSTIDRPAVVVKIDNHPDARPQTGLNEADLVYEVKVEGITRFAAVFHSRQVNRVGPIRSARSTDIDLVANLNHPLFAWSGGNGTVIGEVKGAQRDEILQDVGHDAAPDDYWRDDTRRKPHNLYSSTSALLEHAWPFDPPPAPVFTYRGDPAELPATAQPVTGVSVDFGGQAAGVEYVWDPEVGGWRRFETDSDHSTRNSAHVDSSGVQVAPPNVVVMGVEYKDSAAGAYPQAVSTGSGEAYILTDGRMVVGRWVRPEPGDPIRLEDADGAEVKLTPGQTWVLLPSPGKTVGLSPDRGVELLSNKR